MVVPATSLVQARAVRLLFLIPLGMALLLTFSVVRDTYSSSVAALQHREVSSAGAAQATALLFLGLVTALCYWFPRRGHHGGVGLAIASCSAALVVVLGAATYGPCVSAESGVFAPVGWILSLFTGDYEFNGPGSVCALAFPSGLELARTIGLIVTVSGALGVVWVLARRQLDRARVSWSGDVDVVVGLDKSTLQLVQALVDENRSRPRRDNWIDKRPGWRGGSSRGVQGAAARWWWLTGLRPGDARRLFKVVPRTVVIESDPDNPLVSQAQRSGAVVLIGDATDVALLRSVITRLRFGTTRRTALRRLYAVTPQQRLNLEIWATVVAELTSTRLERHLDDLVPRVFVRMDDDREARQWRLAQIQHLGSERPGEIVGSRASANAPPMLVSDSLTVDGIAAELVAGRILPQSEWLAEHSFVTHVVLIGEGSLALAVLDELAWQLWCRYEVALEAERGGEASTPKLGCITLAGPKAALRKQEWDDMRAPWAFPTLGKVTHRFSLFDVLAADEAEGWETTASNALDRDPNSVVVFVEGDAQSAAAASRLARRFPITRSDHVRVMLLGDVDAASSVPVVPGGLFRFVPTLVRSAPSGVLLPPQDSVTRLAQQQHSVYNAEAGWPSGAPPTEGQQGATRLTAVDWEALPAFFREDNVRQHWQILSWFTRLGFSWQPLAAGGVKLYQSPGAGEVSWASCVLPAAKAEYQRWAYLRTTHGWWACDEGSRDDPRRLHPDLRGWEFVDITFNERLIRQVVERMSATGLNLVWTGDAQQEEPAGSSMISEAPSIGLHRLV